MMAAMIRDVLPRSRARRAVLAAIGVVIPALSYLGPLGTRGSLAWSMYARGVVLDIHAYSGIAPGDSLVPIPLSQVASHASGPAAPLLAGAETPRFYAQAHALLATFPSLPARFCRHSDARAVTVVLRVRPRDPGGPTETRTARLVCPR
jgi:hypothetical protein